MDYGLNNAQAALDAASAIGSQVRDALQHLHLLVNLADGSLDFSDGPLVETPASTPEATGPVTFTAVADGDGFDVQTAWALVPSLGEGVHRLTLTLTRKDPAANHFDLTFPRTEDVLVYSPAMLETEVQTWPLSQFAAANLNVPLANGLLGLGSGVFLVKDLATYHLSAFLPKAEPVVRFRDQTLNGPGPYVFVLYVATGMTAEQARALAWKVNVKPVVVF